ncbi:YceD family protein [Celeribacter litoreus]|uniref:YceD family protein n=1 Tax=Celeribacter litoreus TaxID=2876714 RepID=UPI0029625080|nr:YceD family protein [Celeribacter litoreus]
MTPTSEECEEIATALGLSSLRKVKFEGKLTPVGKRDWQLEATLGATVVQPCVATLAPVTTRIDTEVTRSYLSDFDEAFDEGGEDEMPSDDTIEPLPLELILSTVAEEALALAAPDYPRAEGADLGVTQFTEPGQKAMSDEDAKPFASLKALRDKLDKKDD